MKKGIFGFMVGIISGQGFADDIHLSIVSHRWQDKIVESNYVTIRPGSVYDISTYFEQNFGFPNPKFNYLFRDTGLGAADPIYPVFQSGHQGGWHQLLPAMFSKKNRHIDHYSRLPTPEGCLVESSYLVRHIDEFPNLYHQEREEGYTLVDISFDYYTKLKPEAQCGRHRSHLPDRNFDPIRTIKKYAKKFKSAKDLPPEILQKYEFKIGLLRMISEEFNSKKWPRFKDVYTLENNSLWYYPNGFEPDYGIRESRPQFDFAYLDKPSQFIIPASFEVQNRFPVSYFLHEEFNAYVDFLDGRPTHDYDIMTEPGKDALQLSDVTNKHIYSHGLEVVPIHNVYSDVSNPSNYKLVSIVIRPYEPEEDILFTQPEKISQLRFVYQLVDPHDSSRHYDQLFLHLIYDAVDREAPPEIRQIQTYEFLKRVDDLAYVENFDHGYYNELLSKLIEDSTQRPVQALSFSSALTGIWVFGSLSRSYNEKRNLEAVRIIREGVDVGYYSTAYDNNLFREAMMQASGERRKRLETHLKDLSPEFYRDPRRMDPHAMTFNRMTCAQCHQMSGRDGIHISFNDHLDRRITTPIRATEYLFREIDRQLMEGP